MRNHINLKRNARKQGVNNRDYLGESFSSTGGCNPRQKENHNADIMCCLRRNHYSLGPLTTTPMISKWTAEFTPAGQCVMSLLSKEIYRPCCLCPSVSGTCMSQVKHGHTHPKIPSNVGFFSITQRTETSLVPYYHKVKDYPKLLLYRVLLAGNHITPCWSRSSTNHCLSNIFSHELLLQRKAYNWPINKTKVRE